LPPQKGKLERKLYIRSNDKILRLLPLAQDDRGGRRSRRTTKKKCVPVEAKNHFSM